MFGIVFDLNLSVRFELVYGLKNLGVMEYLLKIWLCFVWWLIKVKNCLLGCCDWLSLCCEYKIFFMLLKVLGINSSNN